MEQVNKFILELYRGSHDVPMAEFQEWVFEQLGAVINFDSALWLTSVLHAERDDATFHTRHLHRLHPQVLVDWAQCKDAAVFSRKVCAAPGTSMTCTPSAEFGPELAAHARRYRIEHILATAQIEPVTGIIELISIYRDDLSHPFSEEERLIQQRLVPHLSSAWRMCRMRHLLLLTQSPISQQSWAAAADSQGLLYLADSNFTRILLEEWPDWNGPELPAELLETHRSNDLQYFGQHSVFLLSRHGDHILLRARSRKPVDSLSRRELEISMHFANGLSHKEIAGLLDLSPATIRNHLGNVYSKLGIDNKAALSSIVSLHSQLPGSAEPDRPSRGEGGSNVHRP